MVSALIVLLVAAPKLLNVEGEPAARMAYGLEVPLEGSRELTARAYLASHAGDFGLLAEDELKVISDHAGVVTFDRRRAGVSVMSAEVKATFDDSDRLVMVYLGPPLPRAEGDFWVDVVRAEVVATHGLDAVAVDDSRRFWKNDGDALRPVWLVRFRVGDEPFRALVDAATGRLRYRITERLNAGMGTVYDVSPAKGGVVMRALGGLPANATTLNGSRATARNCNGSGTTNTTTCVPRKMANASFDFSDTPSPFLNNTDQFGEITAYYGVDRYAGWIRSLDAGYALPGIDIYTNVGGRNEGFFNGGSPRYGIVLGQGPEIDWAYENDVTWHELGHGVVDGTASFGFYSTDSQGLYGEGGSLNEGSADVLAMAYAGDAVLGEFVGPSLMDAGSLVQPYLRRVDQVVTCHGYDGNLDGGNPGRFGEIHDDGRIIGSYFWALHQRSQSVGQYAAAEAYLRALRSVNGSAGYYDVTLAIQQHMASRFGAQAGELAACLQCERDMSGCSSRTRRMYDGETHETRLLGNDISAPSIAGQKPQTFQYELQVPAGAAVTFDRFATTVGMLPNVYARFNSKVSWSGSGPTYDFMFDGGGPPQTLPPRATAGTWYLQGALRDPGAGTRRYGLRPQLVGGATRPALPATCTLGGGVGSCICMPQCTGRACGSDGCGGTCGSCDAGTMCSGGTCACVPQCTGRGCGPDGCGGTCGTCASGTCNTTTGMCEGCTPVCTGKLCGPNGCGQSCGQCMGANVVCDLPTGQCVDAGEPPVPDAGAGGGAGGGSGGGGGDEDIKGSCGCGAAPSFVVLALAGLLLARRRRAC